MCYPRTETAVGFTYIGFIDRGKWALLIFRRKLENEAKTQTLAVRQASAIAMCYGMVCHTCWFSESLTGWLVYKEQLALPSPER